MLELSAQEGQIFIAERLSHFRYVHPVKTQEMLGSFHLVQIINCSFGITVGNSRTLSLGMTMSQLTNPDRYSPYRVLWEDHAPQGERLELYADREAKGRAIGMVNIDETPRQDRLGSIGAKL